VYNLGSSETRENIELARTVCGLLDDLTAAAPGTSAARIAHTDDRPGHDRRYNMDCSKAAHALGWRASTPFQEGLARTVRWYLSNEQWWSALTRERYDLRRLGAPSTPARAHAG
jgi:dTDP-glucose 4,6-dehydratase